MKFAFIDAEKASFPIGRNPGQDGIDQLRVVAADAGQFLLEIGSSGAACGLQAVALF